MRSFDLPAGKHRKKATASLGEELAYADLDGAALVVADRTTTRLLRETGKQTFNSSGITPTIHPFCGECSLVEIDRIKKTAKDKQSDVIVGSGGGKVLDAARPAVTDLNLPVVTCPMVASSDAPCSALSVIYSDEGVIEPIRIFRKNPDFVLVDTQVIAMSPPRLLVSGMEMFLAKWYEAKTCG